MAFFKKVVNASLIVLLLPVGIALPARSQTEQSQTEQNFLWSVETPTNTVYLLGSIHFLSEADYPLSEPIQAAFEDAEQVVFEIDVSTVSNPENTAIVLERAQPDSENESLLSALDADSYALAEVAAAEVGLPLAGFNRFEPWFFTVTLTSLKLLQLGFSAEYGIDSYLFQQAIDADKEILALETLSDQMNIFDTLSIETQQDLLSQTLTDLAILETSFNEMRMAWTSGDTETLERLLLEGFGEYPDLEHVLITQRNQNWLEQLNPLFNQSEDALIVVGAGHLVGETGLLNQLQSRGYQLEQH